MNLRDQPIFEPHRINVKRSGRLRERVILDPATWDKFMHGLAQRWIAGWFASTAIPPEGCHTVHAAEWLARDTIEAIYVRDWRTPLAYREPRRPVLRQGEYDSSYWTGRGRNLRDG